MSNHSVAVVVVASLALIAAAPSTKPQPAAKLTDAAGDVHQWNGAGNSRDVVELTLSTDGSHLLIGVRLAAEDRGTMAGNVVDLYLDTDDDPSTGGKSEWGLAGFEFQAALNVCLDDRTGKVCSGGADDAIKRRHSSVLVERFRGQAGAEMDGAALTMVQDDLQSTQTDVAGKEVTEKVAYAVLGLQKGKVVRIVAHESDGDNPREKQLFPEVRLTVK